MNPKIEPLVDRIVEMFREGKTRAAFEQAVKDGTINGLIGFTWTEVTELFDAAEAKIGAGSNVGIEPEEPPADAVKPGKAKLKAMPEDDDIFLVKAECFKRAMEWLDTQIDPSDLDGENAKLTQMGIRKITMTDLAHMMLIHADSLHNNQDSSSPRKRFLRISATSLPKPWDWKAVKCGLNVLIQLGFTERTSKASSGKAECYRLLLPLELVQNSAA